MPTVLYIHGLEAGPEGRKSAELRRVGYSVVAHQMPCGQRHLVRDPVVLASLLTTGATLASIGKWVGPRTAAVGALSAFAMVPFALSRVMRRVFARSVAVQRAALLSTSIDAVVASSFGGAVALALLTEGAWRGPTLLLCPAHELVAERSWHAAPPGLSSLAPAIAARVLVVHGSRDETVPLASSERLVRGSTSRLWVVDDDHRLKRTATGEQLRAWLEGLAEPPRADTPG